MLCQQLARMGHEVTVIATVPHYPTGRVDNKNGKKGWIQHSFEDGVNVVRIRKPSGNRNNFVHRLFQYFVYQLGATIAGLRCEYDAVLITNPALEVFIAFVFLVFLVVQALSFLVADVYPQVGIQLGIFRNRFVIGVVDAIERFCLHHSRLVWIFSDSFRMELKRMGVPDDKMVLVHSWVDTEFIRILPRTNSFSEAFQLNEKFVVLYAGNIGLSQDWESVLTAAHELSERDDILFVLVGDGSGKAALQTRVGEQNLRNLRFIEFQPHERIPEVLATADVSIATLQSGMAAGSIPSKIFSYLASGRPVIGILDEDSDACRLIHHSGGGVCVAPANSKLFAKYILDLKESQNRRDAMGRAGRSYVENNHSVTYVAKRVEEMLLQVRNLPRDVVDV
ncbi:MAG: glycosyltransferase family 4 protein [Anaerolineae bacterium]